ncbi:meiotic spindle pole body protein Kms1 [Ancistrocladus abbreviatus]
MTNLYFLGYQKMGSKKRSTNSSNSSVASTSRVVDSSISGLQEKHQQELENLTLTTQPFRTLKFFILAIVQYFKQSIACILAKGGWPVFLAILIVVFGVLFASIEGSHEKHVQMLFQYGRFVLWWTSLGIASSIGLGSGLHTFVLYLGPHIALFTIKAMQCGRVDLKSAPYDTIQLKRGPSWLDKNCSEFGPPLFKSVHGSRIPLSSILPQVQLEAILWGVGTALGELPPYFISRAARLSGSKLGPMEELDGSSSEDKQGVDHLKQIKCWLISHTQFFNFFTVLLLASVPNPLFDLAGIVCGQFGVPFWKFFLATLVGKAILKTHIQTVFVISVCNNQLLDWVENELTRVLSLIPAFASVLPDLIVKLHAVKDKYLSATSPVPSNVKVSNWGLSFASMWNAVVWLVLLNFVFKIVNAIAQSFLKKQQEEEFVAMSNRKPTSTH